MRKLLMLIILMLGFISCDKFGDNRDLVNYIGTGVFHDTWGTVDNQSSVSWDVTPISADHVKNEITYLKVMVNAYYTEYKYSEVLSDEEFLRFMKEINRKERTSDIVNINDSIKCTWRLFDKIYKAYIK
jgi:hypothetical protein